MNNLDKEVIKDFGEVKVIKIEGYEVRHGGMYSRYKRLEDAVKYAENLKKEIEKKKRKERDEELQHLRLMYWQIKQFTNLRDFLRSMLNWAEFKVFKDIDDEVSAKVTRAKRKLLKKILGYVEGIIDGEYGFKYSLDTLHFIKLSDEQKESIKKYNWWVDEVIAKRLCDGEITP